MDFQVIKDFVLLILASNSNLLFSLPVARMPPIVSLIEDNVDVRFMEAVSRNSEDKSVSIKICAR